MNSPWFTIGTILRFKLRQGHRAPQKIVSVSFSNPDCRIASRRKLILTCFRHFLFRNIRSLTKRTEKWAWVIGTEDISAYEMRTRVMGLKDKKKLEYSSRSTFCARPSGLFLIPSQEFLGLQKRRVLWFFFLLPSCNSRKLLWRSEHPIPTHMTSCTSPALSPSPPRAIRRLQLRCIRGVPADYHHIYNCLFYYPLSRSPLPPHSIAGGAVPY